MLLILWERLGARWPAAGELFALDKITLRASLAALASFVLALVCGPRLIRWLKGHFREPIKSASAQLIQLHATKQATPTMGGLFIVGGLVASTLVFGDWTNPFVPLAMVMAAALATLGAIDDLVKLRTSARGLSPRAKILAQSAIALATALVVYRLHPEHNHGLELTLPLVETKIALGWLFVPWSALVIVGASNAVNLADGLDGLAGGCLVCATGGVAIVAYACGHAGWAQYLGIPHLAGAGEMAVIAAGMIGALLGFLWFNCHPASVFMGDTGALPLGGLLGLLAVIARQELLLVVIGGVFVAEAASVILQVAFFRWKKRRIFLCAPVHHHFQLQGWPEGKIVVRFWIAAALCAVLGLAGLKLRAPGSESRAQLTAAQRLIR